MAVMLKCNDTGMRMVGWEFAASISFGALNAGCLCMRIIGLSKEVFMLDFFNTKYLYFAVSMQPVTEFRLPYNQLSIINLYFSLSSCALLPLHPLTYKEAHLTVMNYS